MQGVLSHFSFVLPVDRLEETDSLLAFHHPHPSYALHILLVPKRAYRSWMELEVQDRGVLQDMVVVSQHLIERFNLEEEGYRLIVNGGANQDVDVLHLHLISDAEI